METNTASVINAAGAAPASGVTDSLPSTLDLISEALCHVDTSHPAFTHLVKAKAMAKRDANTHGGVVKALKGLIEYPHVCDNTPVLVRRLKAAEAALVEAKGSS